MVNNSSRKLSDLDLQIVCRQPPKQPCLTNASHETALLRTRSGDHDAAPITANRLAREGRDLEEAEYEEEAGGKRKRSSTVHATGMRRAHRFVARKRQGKKEGYNLT